jgi:uncharacterized protein YjbI with pentapeptide repeats
MNRCMNPVDRIRRLNAKNLLAIAMLFVVLICGVSSSWVPAAWALDYNKEILVKADFANRDLTDSSFTKANLREADFSNSNLQGVSFFAANLESANLSGVNLSNSTLDSARLSSANLTNAILEGAFAFNAKFEAAVIEGADFTDIQVREDTRLVLCKLAQGVNPKTKRATRETLFCDE